ncbi:MAG: hypothetical protein QNK20_08015 [Aureibaculum sp.]|nr:hypothetical protein [Aureibaculum sp.]
MAVVAVILFMLKDNTEDMYFEISKYPDGKDFALTITDDPDYGWLEQKNIVYDFLDKLGYKTTIPVWVLDNKHGTGQKGVNSGVGGITTNDKKYLKHTKALQKKGFEIALHTVGPGNDLRDETILGYELFKERFGQYPKININHTSNNENIYWGGDRFSNKIMSYIYNLKTPSSLGHVEESKYFWGDVSKTKTKYIRGWATDNINTLSVNKSMPYHLEDKPYVNYWFGCSDGFEYNKFINLISDENINKLLTERGTSIIYTHFGYGFVDSGANSLSEEFIKQMTRISQKNGWFVPVSTILDRFMLLRNIEIVNRNSNVLIVNNNDKAINGLTILTNQKRLYFFNTNEWKTSNNDGEIILGSIPPYSVFKLGAAKNEQIKQSPETFERINMVWDWFISR